MLKSTCYMSVSELLIVTAISVVVSGCGAAQEADSALTELTIDSPAQSEGDSGTTQLSFSVSLDKIDDADVSIDYVTADDSASAASDYVALNGSLIIPAGDTSGTIAVTINGDIEVESDEYFSLNLSNITSNATLATSIATATILNDDVVVIPPTPSSSALNDTGVTSCSDDFVNGLSCNDSGDGTDQFPGQDAEHGRDVTDKDDSDGVAGFVFTKLDINGNPLGDQSADYVTTSWSCVQDETTGLTWEVKTDDDGLQDKDWTYSWYNNSGIGSGVIPGARDGGQCEVARDCDTEGLTIAVNDAQLCGFEDWRLPTRHELISLMHFGSSAAPYIDTNYFVNSATLPYWSATPTTLLSSAYVNYSEFGARSAARLEDFAVRLVRGGE